MITMGIRAAPTSLTFAIMDSEKQRIVNVEEIKIPAAFGWPEALKYVRSSLLDTLRIYGVEAAGVRTSEPSARSYSIERIQIEGVIQEAFASSLLGKYFTGPISVAAAVLGIDRKKFKPMVKEAKNDFGVDGWKEMSEAAREAVLYALGAANA